ncbi:MAG: DUF4838 domain-containing protein [Kiritimatiellae bacterium]|nr:DUF4838 domain-containing protein [Kiritimatiellia bacterium]
MRSLAFTFAVAVLLPVCADDLRIAVRGEKAKYSILIPKESPPSQTYAASELQKFVKQMTDVHLPVRRDAAKGACIHLQLDPKMEDSFRICASGRDVVIAGGARGVLYGVYELLEKYAGCGWFSSQVSVIPRKDVFALPPDIDDCQKPAFVLREPLFYDMFNGDFAARCKVNGDFRVNSKKRPPGKDGLHPRHGGPAFPFDPVLKNCHTFSKLIPPSEFFDEHPEYYSLVNGERQRIGWQPCLSNPDVLRIVTERVLARIRANPQTKIFGVSQEDGGKGQCRCPECKAFDDSEGSPSASVIRFVNRVAEAVEKEFPDVIIETLAYQYSTLPPKTVRPRRNVMICLCARTEHYRPILKSRYPRSIEFADTLRKWRDYASMLYVWDYVLNYKFQSHAFPDLMSYQDNIRFYRDCGVTHLFSQGVYASPRSDFAELKAWILAKLMWNPEQDFDMLLTRFLDGFYGAAAPFVREYIEKLHAIDRDEVKYPLTISEDVVSPSIPDGFFDWASGHFGRAEKVVADDPVRRENVAWCRSNADCTRVLRFLRGPCGYLVASREPSKRAHPRLAEMRAAARRVVSMMDSTPEFRISEQSNRWLLYQNQIRRLAEGNDAPSDRCTIEDELVWMDPTVKQYCRYEQDPAAGNGRAMYISGKYKNWTTHFNLNQINADFGVSYLIRARVRVDKRPDAKGEAFRAVMGDSKRPSQSVTFKLGDVSTGYAWYDLYHWIPGGENADEFHFASGLFEGSNPPYTAIYVDCFEIVRETALKPERKSSRVTLEFLTKDRFIAHGGGSKGVIPNTMPAFRKTMEAGFGVEADVFLSEDGKLWCFHDRRGHGKLGIEKWCTNMFWKGEIEKSDYSRAFGVKGRGVRPALLEEVLPLVSDGSPIELDLKDPRGERLISAIRDLVARFPNVTTNNCFLAGRGDLVPLLMPGFKTIATRNSRPTLKPDEKPYSEEMMLKKLGPKKPHVKAVGVRWDPEVTTASLFRKYHERGIEVWVWSYHRDSWLPVDDPKTALRAFEIGADRIICEDPAALYAEVRRLVSETKGLK